MNIYKSRLAKDKIIFPCFFLLFLSVYTIRSSRDIKGVLWGDTAGYYMYLPTVFIYKMHPVPDENVPDKVIVGKKNERGDIILKYTCGTAFFYLPFFLAAHTYAHLFHYNTFGFSLPYTYAIIFCGVFWAFSGLYFLKRLLLKYFSWRTTWVTLLCIMFGTNFFHYATSNYIGMSHLYSFALVAAILLLTDSYYVNPGKRVAILLGLLTGWLVLIRPTNGMLLLFILLYKVTSLNDLKQRSAFLKARASDIILAMPFFILTWIPQVLYWKTVLGKWLVYSYGDESFLYWQHPKIARVLFDTQNGLFLYSPVLLLVFWGFIAARKDPRTNFIGVSTVFIVITYLFASWWAWWFGGAFGHRCYIEYFPVFSFPMAIAIEKITALKKSYVKIPVTIVIILFIYYSVGMSVLYDYSWPWDGPAWQWNWSTWLNAVKQIF